MQKGQVSLYFALGITLIALLGAYLIFLVNIHETNNVDLIAIDLEFQRVSEYAESCLKNTAYEGLSKKIALQGGYLSLDGKPSAIFQGYSVPIWNEGILDKSPNINDAEKGLSQYIIENISGCIQSFKPKNEGIIITYPDITEISVNTSFDDQDTKIALIYPMILTFGASEKKLGIFSIKLSVKFKKDFELAKRILKEIIQAQPGFYDIRANCINYPTKGYIHIYGFDLSMAIDDKINVIGVYDYEPTLKDQTKALRLLFAIQNLNQLGYCG